MALRPKLQNFGKRDWEEIRDAWLANIPIIPSMGARPDPSLEHLQPLLDIPLPTWDQGHGRFPDVAGLRSLTLWEAVFLFHKCSHTHLAAQRLGRDGMHSWCLFNAYHSAYLGARGVMALLGVALPELNGRQVGIDLYPEPEPIGKKKAAQRLGLSKFQDFLLVPLPTLKQRDLWEAFQRVMRMANVTRWDAGIYEALLVLDHEKITPSRNWFLYKAQHWPLDDLMSDILPSDLAGLVGAELDTGDPGFLLRLSCSVYRIFEQLMSDLAKYSANIRTQLEASRCFADPEVPELKWYKDFVAQTEAQPGGAL